MTFQTLTNLAENGVWTTIGNKANTGATGVTAEYDRTLVPTPSLDGQSAAFHIKNPSTTAYADGYWFRELAADIPNFKDLTQFSLGFRYFINSAVVKQMQCLEFELHQVVDGKVFNMAWQADIPLGKWRVFVWKPNAQGYWVETNVPCGIVSDRWVHVYADFQRTPTGTRHVAINIDGVGYPVNIDHAFTQTTMKDKLNVAFQLDTKPGADFTVYVDQMNLKYA